MNVKLFFLLLTLLFAGFIPAKRCLPSTTETGYALLIGTTLVNEKKINEKYNIVASYKEGERCVRNDVENIKRVLKKNKFTDENISEFSGKQITKKEVIDQLKSIFSKLKPGDIFVFFYSGHGQQIPDKMDKDELDDHLDCAVLRSSQGQELKLLYYG